MLTSLLFDTDGKDPGGEGMVLSKKKHRLRVVGALMFRDGAVLLTRRPAQKTRGGLWEFPGGKVEKKETDVGALGRELREELGVDARVGSRFDRVLHEYGDLSVDLVIYRCDIGVQNPKCLEVTEFAWVRPERLFGYDLTPADLPIAARIVREMVGSEGDDSL